MLAHDPTGWPDVNPLLQGPRAGAQRLPDERRTAPAGGDRSSSECRGGPVATPVTGTRGRDTKPAAATTDGGGVPVWVWPLAAVVVLGAAAAASH